MAPSWRWPGQWGFAGWISPQRDISFLLLLLLVVFISSMCADFFFLGVCWSLFQLGSIEMVRVSCAWMDGPVLFGLAVDRG